MPTTFATILKHSEKTTQSTLSYFQSNYFHIIRGLIQSKITLFGTSNVYLDTFVDIWLILIIFMINFHKYLHRRRLFTATTNLKRDFDSSADDCLTFPL